MVRRWIGVTAVTAVAAAVLAWCASGFVVAEVTTPKVKPKAAATEKPAAGDAEKPAPVAKPVDPFAVPEGTDAKVLELFLKRLSRAQPKARTPEAYLEHFQKLEKVADELLTRELDEEFAPQVVEMKIQIMTILPQVGDETAIERRAEFLAKSLEDPRPSIVTLVKQILKGEKVQKIAELKKPDRAALIQELAKDIQDGELTEAEVQFAMQAGNLLASEAGENEEAAAAMNLFAKYIEANGSPNAAEIVKPFRGMARRLSLPGNPIEISGTKMDGKEFKIEELKGQVVLVDFWATWCGPCVAELPNVQEQYALYHDKGFEVVGISLDDDRPELEAFLKEKKLPWIQLHQNDGSGWANENAARYAISGIPACFLIDQKGNVVSLECRGEALPEMLAKLLGPVEKKVAPPKTPEKAEKSE